MTRSALIDMAVREAIAYLDADPNYYYEPPSKHLRRRLPHGVCELVILRHVRSEWPRLLSSHPIDMQGGSHEREVIAHEWLDQCWFCKHCGVSRMAAADRHIACIDPATDSLKPSETTEKDRL
jgi:hypothetical protein